MTIFNRLVAIIFLLIILALAVGAVGIATGLLTLHAVDRVHAYAPLHHALSDFHTSHPQETRVFKVAGAGAIGLITLLLLLREVTPPRRERLLHLVENRDGAVTIGYSTVRKIAEMASMDIPGVQRARCTIARDNESLRVQCHAAIDRYANAEVVGGQVEAAIKRQLEQTLSRPVERVTVRIEPQPANAQVRLR